MDNLYGMDDKLKEYTFSKLSPFMMIPDEGIYFDKEKTEIIDALLILRDYIHDEFADINGVIEKMVEREKAE